MTRSGYREDMRRASDAVKSVPCDSLHTSWGTVEYVDQGTGTSVLMSHGIFGGHPDAAELVQLYAGPGYRTIGPSRFGYLGSTASLWRSPSRECPVGEPHGIPSWP